MREGRKEKEKIVKWRKKTENREMEKRGKGVEKKEEKMEGKKEKGKKRICKCASC